MRIGRLMFDYPIWGFEFNKGACGCILIGTPLVYITWLDKNCKCLACKQYVCKCCEDWK